MILKIWNVGLIRNPEMVFLNDFKRLLEPYVKDDLKISNEVWTVSKDKTTIQVLRPNGFKIEIMQ